MLQRRTGPWRQISADERPDPPDSDRAGLGRRQFPAIESRTLSAGNDWPSTVALGDQRRQVRSRRRRRRSAFPRPALSHRGALVDARFRTTRADGRHVSDAAHRPGVHVLGRPVPDGFTGVQHRRFQDAGCGSLRAFSGARHPARLGRAPGKSVVGASQTRCANRQERYVDARYCTRRAAKHTSGLACPTILTATRLGSVSGYGPAADD